MFYSSAEEGLEKAKKTTEAIYSQNIDAWSSLNIDELRQILDGATIIDMNFRDGYTLKELVMDIRCFLTEGCVLINIIIFYVLYDR